MDVGWRAQPLLSGFLMTRVAASGMLTLPLYLKFGHSALALATEEEGVDSSALGEEEYTIGNPIPTGTYPTSS
jgi:hypothetical protein